MTTPTPDELAEWLAYTHELTPLEEAVSQAVRDWVQAMPLDDAMRAFLDPDTAAMLKRHLKQQ